MRRHWRIARGDEAAEVPPILTPERAEASELLTPLE